VVRNSIRWSYTRL